jgi:hypothetical protein
MNLLKRREAAEYLKSKGIRSSAITLAKQAMTGEGAKYTLIGGTAYYKSEWLDEWLESQIKPQRHSYAHMAQKGGHND